MCCEGMKVVTKNKEAVGMATEKLFSMEELMAYCTQYGFIFREVKSTVDWQIRGITGRSEHALRTTSRMHGDSILSRKGNEVMRWTRIF